MMTPKQTLSEALTAHVEDRRQFFITTAAVGGALVAGFGWPRRADAVEVTTPAAPWYREPSVPEINAWIVVAPDDTVTIRIGQTELGQGVWTACAMMIAEELQCEWSKVRGEYASANRDAREKAPEWTLKNPAGPKPAPTDPRGGGGAGDLPATNERVSWLGVYRRMATHRSGSVKFNLYYYQMAGAEARERLLLAAAERWGVPTSELTAKDSIITHTATGRTVRYGEVAARAAQLQHPHPEMIKIKSAHEFSLMGTERKNLDVPSKVTGQAVYAIDVKVPGTLYACAKACPVWGGDVKSYDFDTIKGRPGVHSVVQFPKPDPGLIRNRQFSGGVAVIADSWWHAKTALDALPIEWAYPPYTHLNTENMRRALIDAIKEPGRVLYQRGNVEEAMGEAAKVLEASYEVPYLARARMEPGNATALVTDDRVDIWIGDQSPQETRFSASQIVGIPQQNVYVHTAHLGGGFGRNGNGPQAEHAVMVAKAVKGRPVKLQWTREEDWSVGTTYRAMGAAHMLAGLGADGYPIAMDLRAAADRSAAAPEHGLVPGYFAPQPPCVQSFRRLPRSMQHATGDGQSVKRVLRRKLRRRDGSRGGQGSVRVPPGADLASPLPLQRRLAEGARPGRRDVRMGEIAARRVGPRHCDRRPAGQPGGGRCVHGVCRGVHRVGQQSGCRPSGTRGRCARRRLWLRQSVVGKKANRGTGRVGMERRHAPGVHSEGRTDGTEQLPQLPGFAHERVSTRGEHPLLQDQSLAARSG